MDQVDDIEESRRIQGLRDAVARAPRSPGCYLWKDPEGSILYVGKAVDLRSRTRSYLRPDTIKTRFLMERAHALEWISTDSGSDALILEANLIKKYKPPYNVRLKDDKKYPFIAVTTSETYPQILITRTVKDDGNRYFGPYTDVRSARRVIEFIHKIFPIRKVRQKLPLKIKKRPCMNFHIHRCLAPCQGDVDPAEYEKIVQEILLFLEGRREILENLVVSRMEKYSEELEFEKAAIYRDLLKSIRRSTEEQGVMSPGGGDEDLVAMARQDDDGQIVLMEVRGGRLLERKSFPLVGLRGADDEETITSFVRDYYLETPFIPPRILVPLRIKESGDLEKAFGDRAGRAVKIRMGASGEIRSLQQLATRNAELLLKERLLATKVRSARTALEDVQQKLGLESQPTVMECYDISHLSGTMTVASGVRFVDGEPRTNSYRKYRIRTTDGGDDPGAMAEVIARRLQRLLNENAPLPELIVIDGGPTQLQAACRSASALGLESLPMVGLAKKREEIYFPGDPIPKSFDPNSPGLRLLRRMRDEAHRFGVTYQKKLRPRTMLSSRLDGIPDIGPSRKKLLNREFPGDRLLAATRDEILALPGIGTSLANKIYDHLHPEDRPEKPEGSV